MYYKLYIYKFVYIYKKLCVFLIVCSTTGRYFIDAMLISGNTYPKVVLFSLSSKLS